MCIAAFFSADASDSSITKNATYVGPIYNVLVLDFSEDLLMSLAARTHIDQYLRTLHFCKANADRSRDI